MLLLAFAKFYIPNMPKFCMPTFGNGRNNSKTACICLYRVRFTTCIGKPGAIFSTRKTSGKRHVRFPPECVCLAEKLAHVVFWLFHQRLWFHDSECCGALGREPACVTSKVCQLGDCVDWWAHAWQASLQLEYSCCYRVRYQCLAVKSIWDCSLI